ncbi:MAG TPA: class I SAM-dependent methyltransferase [Polyangiaceae bacterium]|nr:class I SAM-dependent methyltransferase [Polyangiaceae bacterium]
MHAGQPEISDLVVAYDAETLARLPVQRDEVLAELERHGMSRAIKIVSAWPHEGGFLDPDFVDRVLLTAHHELTRLSEEFMQGRRMRRILAPLLATLRREGVPAPYRIVDVGCGLGFVTRWLAARGELGSDVELWGCDYNAAFVRFAQNLADEERLGCRFVVANAFQLETPAAIFMSTGVVHHFRGAALSRFMAEQAKVGALAFVHSDIKPSYLAPLGSWIFHEARMREPLAQHDGVLSALRAHPGELLLQSAQDACPGYAAAMFDGERELLPILKVMQMLVGIRQDLWPAFRQELGALLRHIPGFS